MGLPVDAQTGTFRYRAGKFVRRHRLGMGVAAAFLVLSTSFAVVSTVLWQRAETVTLFLKNLFLAADPDSGGSGSPTELLGRGQKLLSDGSFEGELELQMVIAGTLGQILHKRGHYSESREMMEKSLAAARDLHGDVHREVAKRLNNLAALLLEHEDHAKAEQRFSEVIEMREALGEEKSKLFRPKSNLAMAVLRQGRLEEAEVLCRDVLAARSERYKDRLHDEDVATSRHNLAAVSYAQERFEEAESLLRHALKTRRLEYESPHTRVAATLDLLGSVVAAQQGREEAEKLYKEALNMRKELLGENHRDVARTRKNLAALVARSDPENALELVTKALAVFDDLRPDGWDASEAKSIQGMALVGRERYSEAEPLLTKSYDHMVQLRGGRTYRSQLALARVIELYEAWGRSGELERYQALVDRPLPTR